MAYGFLVPSVRRIYSSLESRLSFFVTSSENILNFASSAELAVFVYCILSNMMVVNVVKGSYEAPEIECIQIEQEGLLCISNESVVEIEGNGVFN